MLVPISLGLMIFFGTIAASLGGVPTQELVDTVIECDTGMVERITWYENQMPKNCHPSPYVIHCDTTITPALSVDTLPIDFQALEAMKAVRDSFLPDPGPADSPIGFFVDSIFIGHLFRDQESDWLIDTVYVYPIKREK